MKLIDTPVGTEIEGFYYKNEFYSAAGIVKQVIPQESIHKVGFIIYLTEDNKNIVTLATGLKLAGI